MEVVSVSGLNFATLQHAHLGIVHSDHYGSVFYLAYLAYMFILYSEVLKHLSIDYLVYGDNVYKY